jgi:hypothetical protein
VKGQASGDRDINLASVSRAGLLAALCLACTWLATRAFRSRQRSI